jgi:hypothetical protein
MLSLSLFEPELRAESRLEEGGEPPITPDRVLAIFHCPTIPPFKRTPSTYHKKISRTSPSARPPPRSQKIPPVAATFAHSSARLDSHPRFTREKEF